MSTKSSFPLRVVAVGASAVLALGVSTGAATAQSGSLESGLGLDIESVLSPTGELFPDPGSLDEAVSSANGGSAAGSSGARGGEQRALTPPSGSGSADSGAAGGGLIAGGAGSLEPIQSGLGEVGATDLAAPAPGILDSESGGTDQRGTGVDSAPAAALTALIAMIGERGGSGSDSVELPPLPSPR